MIEGDVFIVTEEGVGKAIFEKARDAIFDMGGYVENYTPIIENEWYERMKFCGCGDNIGTRNYMQKILEKMSEYPTAASGYVKELEEVFSSDPKAAAYFILYTLEVMGLTEHGFSVWGSSLTEKGKKMLEALQREKAS